MTEPIGGSVANLSRSALQRIAMAGSQGSAAVAAQDWGAVDFSVCDEVLGDAG